MQYSIARIDTTEAAVVCVLYCSFLPTRCGIKSMLCFRNQLFNYKQNRPGKIKDQWNHINDVVNNVDDVGDQQKKHHL